MVGCGQLTTTTKKNLPFGLLDLSLQSHTILCTEADRSVSVTCILSCLLIINLLVGQGCLIITHNVVVHHVRHAAELYRTVHGQRLYSGTTLIRKVWDQRVFMFGCF